MASTATVKVLDVLKVTPEPPPTNPLSLPLTFFDAFWIKFPPVELIFLYKLPDLSPESFRSQLLPKLRRSLSLTLHYFLPLAGTVTWTSSDPDAVLPIILYTPGDAISLTIAESTDDFHHIAGDGVRQASDSFAYIPEFPVSCSSATIMSLQITLFPNAGFCIGVSAHHGVIDGETQAMLMKAWGYTYRQIKDEMNPPLPQALTPVFDRTRIANNNSDEVALVYWNNWIKLQQKLPGPNPNPNPRSLEPVWSLIDRGSKRLLRATFELSRERISKLKQELIPQITNPNYLSSFVVTLAHTAVCIVKAKRGKQLRGDDATIQLAFAVDFRSRLEPPEPRSFFGNCVSPFEVVLRAAEAAAEGGGTAYAAGEIIERLKGMEKGVMVGAKERLAEFLFRDEFEFAIGVAGSPRLGMYGGDFGYGRAAKVEITSTARTGAISMTECKDGSGGVEVGVVLKEEEMDAFCVVFTGRAGTCNL
ncbi:Phenolic glucoside malonyltransferase 2 [Linum grandiflorum]